MKKKIRDLTFEESKIICDNNPNCYNCPLCIYNNDDGTTICLRDIHMHKVLDKEIEVKDEL